MKKRLSVSSDNGVTWETRWISTSNFDPRTNELDEGDLVKVGESIHKVIIRNGRLECPLMAMDGKL